MSHFEGSLLCIRVAVFSDAISLSVALKRPERSFGGTTSSRASSFHGWIHSCVHFRGLRVRVAKPKRDFSQVFGRLQNGQCAAVSQNVRVHAFHDYVVQCRLRNQEIFQLGIGIAVW